MPAILLMLLGAAGGLSPFTDRQRNFVPPTSGAAKLCQELEKSEEDFIWHVRSYLRNPGLVRQDTCMLLRAELQGEEGLEEGKLSCIGVVVSRKDWGCGVSPRLLIQRLQVGDLSGLQPGTGRVMACGVVPRRSA